MLECRYKMNVLKRKWGVKMTAQITNTIDAGIAYQHIIGVIAKLHRAIKVIVTEKPWGGKTTTISIMVKRQKNATNVCNLLRRDVGGKEIAVKLSLV